MKIQKVNLKAYRHSHPHPMTPTSQETGGDLVGTALKGGEDGRAPGVSGDTRKDAGDGGGHLGGVHILHNARRPTFEPPHPKTELEGPPAIQLKYFFQTLLIDSEKVLQ